MSFRRANLMNIINSSIRPYVVYFLPIIAAVMLWSYRPDQDLWTFGKFHGFSPIGCYYALHPMAQNGILLIELFAVYLAFEPQIRYTATILLWSEAAADEIVMRNKAHLQQVQRELSASLGKTGAMSSNAVCS